MEICRMKQDILISMIEHAVVLLVVVVVVRGLVIIYPSFSRCRLSEVCMSLNMTTRFGSRSRLVRVYTDHEMIPARGRRAWRGAGDAGCFGGLLGCYGYERQYTQIENMQCASALCTCSQDG
jgi:hypothetical protein